MYRKCAWPHYAGLRAVFAESIVVQCFCEDGSWAWLLGTQYRVYGPCSREVKRRLCTPVNTARQHGPRSRVVWTGASELGRRTQTPEVSPVFTTREHGPCARVVCTEPHTVVLLYS